MDLARFTREMLKATEYDRSIKVALTNWTQGIAQGLVEHGTECGFDAWRKLCNRYVPLADDMQNISIRQLRSIKPVSENEMDSSFDETEFTREQSAKVRSKEGPMSEKWEKFAILQNLPGKVVQTPVVELKRACSVEEIGSTINTYTFDHKSGLPRGQANPMLYLAERHTAEEDNGQESSNVANRQNTVQNSIENKEHTNTQSLTDSRAKDGQEFYAASKGKGKGKTCWNCGEKDHFQRECPKANDTNIIFLLKGKGKGEGK